MWTSQSRLPTSSMRATDSRSPMLSPHPPRTTSHRRTPTLTLPPHSPPPPPPPAPPPPPPPHRPPLSISQQPTLPVMQVTRDRPKRTSYQQSREGRHTGDH